MPRLACVFIAETLAEAQLVRRQIAGYGIDATIQHDDLDHRSSDGEPASRSAASRDRSPGPRVMVPPEDFEFAREVAEEFESKRQPRFGRDDRPGRRFADRLEFDRDPYGQDGWDADHAGNEIDPDWPRCPRCRRPRLAVCPACQTAGSKFPLADDHSGSSAWLGTASPLARPLLVCTTCDHPFTPEFYRRCEGCGHTFPDGLDTPRSTPVEDAARRGGTFLVTLAMAAAALYVAWRLLR